MIRSFSLLLCSSLFALQTVQAASCCGGAAAIPTLITGDDLAIFSTSLSAGKVDTDVLPTGVWQKRQVDDRTQTLKLQAAHIFQDRFQVGVELPTQTRDRGGDGGGRSSGLGDMTADLGYEFLPDWDYNPLRPHGLAFISLVAPTGKSIYDNGNDNGLSTAGRGLWALGLGSSLNKAWGHWDALTVFEVHHWFARNFENPSFTGEVRPGNGGTFTVGAGYNVGDLRWGGSISWQQEDPIDIFGPNASTGQQQRFATATATASYMFQELLSGNLSYSDQTLFGNPTNAVLSKTLALSLQKRWSR